MPDNEEAEASPTAGQLAEAVAAADLPDIEEAAKEIGVRLLVLDQRVARAKREYAAACAVAYPVFARLRNANIPQVAPDLGQGRAGLFSLLAGGKTTAVDEDELLLLYAVNSASDLEDYVDPAALADERLIKILKDHAPEFVRMRLRAEVRAEVNKEIEKRDGWVPTPGTGELVKVAEVTRHNANGQFQLRPDPRAQQMITAAVDEGRITEDGRLVRPESEEQ